MSSVDVTSDEENDIKILTTEEKKEKERTKENNEKGKGFGKLIFVQENNGEFLKEKTVIPTIASGSRNHDKTAAFITFGSNHNTKQSSEGAQDTLFTFNQDMGNNKNDIEPIIETPLQQLSIKNIGMNSNIKSMDTLNDINKELNDIADSIEKIIMTQRLSYTNPVSYDINNILSNVNDLIPYTNQYVPPNSYRSNETVFNRTSQKANSSRLYNTLSSSCQTNYHYNY